jgi:exo-1,4-beta-D-glucosaminidase
MDMQANSKLVTQRSNMMAEDAVPSTVLAAQTAAGVFPDPYFGMNLRQIPGTTYPIGGIFANMPMGAGQSLPLRLVVSRGVYRAGCGACRASAQWLHFGGINYRGEFG